MIVRLVGGPLAGCVLKATDVPWAGDWLMAGDADWGLYVSAARRAPSWRRLGLPSRDAGSRPLAATGMRAAATRRRAP